jgi:hypothetical protein
MKQDRLFLRACRVLLGKPPELMQLEGLRFSFRVKRTLSREPNALELSISNLSASSRARVVGQKGVQVVLQAGYPTSIGTVFSGQAVSIEDVRDGPTWVTRVQAGDGAAAAGAHAAGSFAGGTGLPAVLEQLAASVGVEPGNLRAKLGASPARALGGHVVHGNAERELDRLVRRLGYQWSIQDGRLQLLREGEATEESAVLLSPSTGLVGSPERGSPPKKGGAAPLRARSLLQPALRPGRKVQLESESSRGLFAAHEVTHVGDTAGADWYSDVELVPVGGG